MEDYAHILTALGASSICYWMSRESGIPLPKIALAYIGGALIAHTSISVFQKRRQSTDPLLDHLNVYVSSLIIINGLSFIINYQQN